MPQLNVYMTVSRKHQKKYRCRIFDASFNGRTSRQLEVSKNLCDNLNEKELIDMGSCCLHVIHGAIQTGHKASGWDVSCGLKALYGLFKDSPAGRHKELTRPVRN